MRAIWTCPSCGWRQSDEKPRICGRMGEPCNGDQSWMPPPAVSSAGVCQGSEADTAQGNLPPDEPISPLKHPETARHAAWLIERSDLGATRYYTTTPKGHGWAADPNVADKFPTEDAARAACQGGDKDGPLKVTEHIWLGLPQSEPLKHPETAVNGDGWEPITEPPEEGAWVFLWWPTMPIAFAPAVVGFNMFDGCGWELPAWRDYGEVFPTHWCPTTVLPPPPTSADASLRRGGRGDPGRRVSAVNGDGEGGAA